jgi:hypothetical protein
VVRGVFGRSGRLETCVGDDDIDVSEDDDDDQDDESDEVTSPKRRVSGLVRLTGTSKTSHKVTSKTRPTVKRSKKTREEVVMVPASDEDDTPEPVIPKRRGRRKSQEAVCISRQGSLGKGKREFSTVPDSEGEAEDIWIVTSGDDR